MSIPKPRARLATAFAIVLLVILRRIFVNVGAREIAIKERRYMGRRMPPGRVVENAPARLPAVRHAAKSSPRKN